MMTSAMKPSGVEWIGEVPSSWDVEPYKYCASIDNGFPADSAFFNAEGKGIPLLRIRDITRRKTETWYSGPYPASLVVGPGDIIIGMDGDFNLCTWEKPKALLNQRCCRISGRKLENRFLFYCMAFPLKQINDLTVSTTVKHLLVPDIEGISLPIPSREEQKRISDYLDKRCTAIDSTVATLEEQIDVLERYRASVIHEAVTRGLDSRVPVKRINTDWIEKIPASWELEPFKRVASVASNLVDPNLYPDMIEIDPDNIESGTGKLVDIKTVGEVGAISAKQLFFKGQILYSKIRPELNKVTIAPDDGLCSADMYPIATSQCGKWLSYVMRSDLFVQQTALISYRVAMPKINVEQLAEIKIPVPPPPEQERIADYLDNRCTTIDEVIDIKSKQLDVLKKRRQSLIYEYVTGKRRVVGEN